MKTMLLWEQKRNQERNRGAKRWVRLVIFFSLYEEMIAYSSRVYIIYFSTHPSIFSYSPVTFSYLCDFWFKEMEDSFLDKAITKISTVCDSSNIYAWGPQQPIKGKVKDKDKGKGRV